MDEDGFALHPVLPWREPDRADDRPFVNLWVSLRSGGQDDGASDDDPSLDRTPRVEATCTALAAALARGGLRTRVVTSEQASCRSGSGFA